MFFLWPDMDSLCGARTVHTGDTDLNLVLDDFVSVDESVGRHGCASRFPRGCKVTVLGNVPFL